MRPPLRLLFAAVLLSGTAPLHAQGFGLAVSGGFDRARIDREGYLADFADSYNAYYTQRIKAPIEPFAQARQRPVVGGTLSYGIDRLYVSFFGQLALDPAEERTADLTGLKNHVSVDLNDLLVGGDVALRFGPVSVGGTYAGTFRRATVLFDTEYADGSVSRGTEYRINGRYTSDNAYLEFGPMLALHFGRISVPVRVYFPYELGEGRTPLTDDDVYELNAYFPSNWPRYLNDASGLDESNAVSDRDFAGPRVQVGIEFRLF